MRLLSLTVAAAALVAASATASAAHHRAQVHGYANGPYGSYAEANGPYANSPYGSYARGNFNSTCHYDLNERSDIAIQDRFYDQSQGKNC